MKRVAILPALLLLAACASSGPASKTPSPVKVVVTADPAVSRYVHTEKLAEVIDAAMHQYAADAPPATVAIHFTSLGSRTTSIDQRTSPERASTGHSVPIISAEPWNEPAQPTTTSPRPAGSSAPSGAAPALQGVYTITDANGTVLEQQPLFMSLDYGDGYSNRLQEQRFTAGYIAQRVAKLTKKQG